MDKLINLLYRNIHSMICRNVPFQFQKIPSHIVYVDKGKLLMYIVLSYIYIEMIESILIYPGLLTPWSHITCHSVRNDWSPYD